MTSYGAAAMVSPEDEGQGEANEDDDEEEEGPCMRGVRPHG